MEVRRYTAAEALDVFDAVMNSLRSDAPDTRCEAHHLHPWWAGGPTALNNLVLLCPHHHKLVEPDRYDKPGDRWHIHIDPDTEKPTITPPQRTEAFIAGKESGTGNGSEGSVSTRERMDSDGQLLPA